MIELNLVIAVFSGIIIPLSAVGYFVIKSFIAKGKYHVSMEAKLERLTENDLNDEKTHNDHDDRLESLEDKVQKLCDNVEEAKGWVRLILDHLKIPYPKHKST